MDFALVASIDFELLRFYVIPALSFLALFLIFMFVILERGDGSA